MVLVLGVLVDALDLESFLKAVAFVFLSGGIAAIVSFVFIRSTILPNMVAQVEEHKTADEQMVSHLEILNADNRRMLDSVFHDVRQLSEDYGRRLELLRGDLNLHPSIILADPQLAETERVGKWTNIYIATEELLVQLGGTKDPLFNWITIMSANLSNGVRYTYIVPNRVHIESRSDAIRQQFSQFLDGGLRFVVLSEDLWSQLPVSIGEYVMYDRAGDSMAVFYVLPLARGKQRRQWVQVGEDLRDHWVGQTLHVMRQGDQPQM